jgi:hypothetical protein
MGVYATCTAIYGVDILSLVATAHVFYGKNTSSNSQVEPVPQGVKRIKKKMISIITKFVI